MIVYGEICGYVDGTTNMIQKGHDYGCRPGQWKFMPYRIEEVDKKGNRKEWNLSSVIGWTYNVKDLIRDKYNDFYASDMIMVPVMVYDGPLKNLYPDIPVDGNWNLNLLERMKSDTEILGMEKQEPLCRMKAPREGVVIRINDDKYPRAWKLKSNLHYELERKAHDAGEHDMEEAS